MGTVTGCQGKADLGGKGLVASGDPSEKILRWPLEPLCFVAVAGSAELPRASLPLHAGDRFSSRSKK
jgi:hypothetical protein